MSLQVANRAWRALRERGFAGALRYFGARAWHVVRPPKLVAHPFDVLHGVDTGGIIGGIRLGSGHRHDQYNTAYGGTAPSVLQGILERWQRTLPAGLRLEDHAFVDIGCGKGRVVMLASERPFREVCGVELNPMLVEIARRNLQRWKERPHACRQIEVLHADATEFDFPQLPALVYLFNPFDRPVMELLLKRLQWIADATGSSIDIVYTQPIQAAVFADWPAVELVWSGHLPLTAEDTASDAFQSLNFACNLYRLWPAGFSTARR